MRSLALAAALVVTAACSKKAADDGPSCDKVVEAILELTKTQLEGHGGMDMGAGGNRQAMIDQCAQRNLSPAQRTCMVAAKDLNALAACTPKPGAPK